MRIVDLSRENQQRVLFLHQAAFSQSACETCEGACCRHCAKTQGYIDDRAIFEELKEKYGFSEKSGFQTPTGCAIPLRERSKACVAYMCSQPPHVERAPQVKTLWSEGQRACANEIEDVLWERR
jgi:hypothetical protein